MSVLFVNSLVMAVDLAWQVFVPTFALVSGALLHGCLSTRTMGKVLVFFGAQTFMNFYMKFVLSQSVVSEELHLFGFPAAFACTAVQQIVSFVSFVFMVGLSQLSPVSYNPKKLETSWEYVTVIVFSSTFVLNIALNNYSLSIVSLSINLIIRSCLPLSTYISQTLFGSWAGVDVRRASPLEMLLMVLGTFCAVVAVYAKSQSKQDGASDNLFLGVFVCVMSLFSGSMNLALAGLLGSKAELNALDTTLYMAVPAVIFLLGPIFLMRHPVEWPNQGNVTDWEIVLRVWSLRPTMMLLVVLSGVFSSFYNVLQYSIVQSLSAAYTAFAGNFNKAATIVIALMLGVDTLQGGAWSYLMLFAVCGNIGCFTLYSVVVSRSSQTGQDEEHDTVELTSSRSETKFLISEDTSSELT